MHKLFQMTWENVSSLEFLVTTNFRRSTKRSATWKWQTTKHRARYLLRNMI